MININEIKNGMTIIIDEIPYVIIEFQHVKPGKGPAFVRTKLKNLRTGANIENTFNSNIKVERAMVEKNEMQYLYNSGDNYVFMNMETYEQIELDKSLLEEEIGYLKENLEVELVFFKEEMLGINLPEKINLLVNSTEPATKGNTATTATKEAILETGLTVRVPLFINEGETIVISTSDGKYVSRK